MALLVNLEAVDRAGKTTQLDAVAASLRSGGLRVQTFAFPNRPSTSAPHPSHASSGVLIDRYLRDGLVLIQKTDTIFHTLDACLEDDRAEAGIGGPHVGLSEMTKDIIRGLIEEKVFQVLQSVNRREHLADLEAALANPLVDVVLTVRLQSAWAYGVAKGVSPIEIRALEGDLPIPDLTVLLELDPAAARSRRSEDAPDKYESDAQYQAGIRSSYHKMARDDAAEAEAEGRPPRFVRVDAGRLPDEVSADILHIIESRRAA